MDGWMNDESDGYSVDVDWGHPWAITSRALT